MCVVCACVCFKYDTVESSVNVVALVEKLVGVSQLEEVFKGKSCPKSRP